MRLLRDTLQRLYACMIFLLMATTGYAQGKSGLDVDNDSLLRTAYTYYSAKPNDSLYAKCQYYMGKYYMLNDSSEKALPCQR